MLTFVDKAEYQLITATFYDPDNIQWEYSENGRFHSGFFVRGLASNYLRNEQEFYPFDEVQQEITVNPRPQSEIDAEAEEQAKSQQAQAIANLTVEVDGMAFQANELSRQRMADAILAAEHLGQTSHIWRLADNTQQQITITQLKEAHAKAIQAFGMIILQAS